MSRNKTRRKLESQKNQINQILEVIKKVLMVKKNFKIWSLAGIRD